jgi:hypothetical protein
MELLDLASSPKISAFTIQRAGFLFGYRNC